MIPGVIEHRITFLRQCTSYPKSSLSVFPPSPRKPSINTPQSRFHLLLFSNVRQKHESRSSRTKRFRELQKENESSPRPRKDNLHSLTSAKPAKLLDNNLPSIEPSRQASQDDILSSTRPIPFESVEPAPRNDNGSISTQERLKYLFRLGKSALKFYKSGLKNVWVTYKNVREIKKRIAPYSVEGAAKHRTITLVRNAETRGPLITRGEYQLCVRSQADLLKLVPFAIIFLICGEFTPLVITFVPPTMVPTTCLLPKQQYQLQYGRAKGLPLWLEEREKGITSSKGADSPNSLIHDLDRISADDLFVTASQLGLNPFTKPIPILTPILNAVLIKPRLRRHCQQILCDTILIDQQGGFKTLTPQEVFEYSFKYGLLTLYQLMLTAYDTNRPFDLEAWKQKLVPLLEEEAENILDCEWSKLRPEMHWLQVYKRYIGNSLDFQNVQRIRGGQSH